METFILHSFYCISNFLSTSIILTPGNTVKLQVES